MTFKSKGRLAGVVYFLLVLTGIFNLMYVPGQLISFQDPAFTLKQITSNELLFRSGITVGIVSYVIYFILPLILFDIFKHVDRHSAVLMAGLAIVSVPVAIFNMVNQVNVLSLLSDASYLQSLSLEQIQTQVMLLLRSYYNGIAVVQIFWGLWLFPFGYLVVKSGYIPKILGVFLMLGCLGYLIKFFCYFLMPDLSVPGFVSIPASIGEIGTCLWLLIMGVKKPAVANSYTNHA